MMVTMVDNNKIETLNAKLAEARQKLEQSEHEQMKIEGDIFNIKENIKDVLIKLETESLPTGLYNKGYKLQERERKFILSNNYGEEVYSFNYVPSLGDLMDAERSILSK